MPIKRPWKRGEVGNFVEKQVWERRTQPREERHYSVLFDVQEFLIERLGFSEQKKRHIRRIEAHSLILSEAAERHNRRQMIEAKNLKNIYSTCLSEIPWYLGNFGSEMGPRKTKRFQEFVQSIKTELVHVQRLGDKAFAIIPEPEILRGAIQIHRMVLQYAMGREKFSIYTRTMEAARRKIANEIR